jgi:hypothetical protein
MFTSLVDLITQSIFLGISPGVKEGLGAFSRGDRKDLTSYKAGLEKNSAQWFFFFFFFFLVFFGFLVFFYFF